MRLVTSLLLAVLLFCTVNVFAVPKVAFIHSSWGFEKEFDEGIGHLGWEMDTYENINIAELMSKLDEYDMVIAGSTANTNNTQNMAPFSSQWLEYLKKGGILLVVDANYDSVLDLWLSSFGPEFIIKTAGCAPYTDKFDGSREVIFDKDDPLLYTSHDLRQDFVNKSNIWSHFESWQPGWKSLITCADNKSLFLYRFVGNGMVVATTYSSLTWAKNRRLCETLSANLMTFKQFADIGLRIEAANLPAAVSGKHKASFLIENRSDTVKEIALIFKSDPEDKVIASYTGPVRIEPGQKSTIPFDVEIIGREPIIFTTEVLVNGTDSIKIFREYDIPELFTFYPEYRHAYKASEANFHTKINLDSAKSLDDCSLEILVDGQKVKTIKSLKPADIYKVGLSKLPLGAHKVTGRLLHKGAELAAIDTEINLHPPAKVRTREDGTLLINGKPEFPFGWYTVSWRLSSQEKVDFIKAIGEAGFNAAHASAVDPEAWKIVLDAAEQYGVKVITEHGETFPKLIDLYKDHPAVLAWNPGDEPDLGGPTPREMLNRAEKFKDIDPHHPSYMVLANPTTYDKYVASADIIAPDVYPVRRENIAIVYNYMRSAHNKAMRYGHPIWGVVQCFGYDKPGSWSIPTINEARNMTYQALLAGAKGIIYYTYYDDYFNVREHPDLWQGMKDLVPEINRIKPYLLNGLPSYVETENKNIVAGIWKNKGKNLMIIANLNQTNNQEISITLPEGAWKTVKPVFDRDTYYISASADKLKGRLQALGVAVFEY